MRKVIESVFFGQASFLSGMLNKKRHRFFLSAGVSAGFCQAIEAVKCLGVARGFELLKVGVRLLPRCLVSVGAVCKWARNQIANKEKMKTCGFPGFRLGD